MPPLATIFIAICLLFCSLLAIAHSQGPVVSDPSPTLPLDPAQLTADELFHVAQKAYDQANWPQAEIFFQAFLDTYGASLEVEASVPKMRALLTICKLRQKKYEETLDLLESSLKHSEIDPVLQDELAFWRGICYLQTEDHDEAISAFQTYHLAKLPYTSKLPASYRQIYQGRCIEAIILQAICLILKEDHANAVEFLEVQLDRIRELNREAAGRATVLLLHSYLSTEHYDEALKLIQSTFQRLDEISQMVAFQSFCLQLGSHLLEQERYYDAILCLQRIWPKDRLLDHQREALSRYQSRLQQIRHIPSQSYLAFQFEGLIARIQRELQNFETIPNFDSSVRFRVAAAYQGLHRYREAALIMEDMLHRLPVDEIVRTASLNLIQCWIQAKRWKRAIEVADTYIQKFSEPDNPDLATAYYLRATALHSAKNPYDAELAYTTVHQKFPLHPLAPRALFMEGICLLEQDLNREAIDAFQETANRYPDSEMIEDTDYWIGMALSFDKQHEEARQHLQDYLERYSQQASYFSDATFRIAHATFSLAEYPTAIEKLREFIDDHPDNSFHDEAKLLLGDALAAEGKIDSAIATYLTIKSESNAKFYEEAQFRIGNIYKQSEQFEPLRAHFNAFITEHPKSSRLAEAVYWIGWSHLSSGHPEKAREAYFSTLRQHGSDPQSKGIEDILSSLPKFNQHAQDPSHKSLLEELDHLLTSHSSVRASDSDSTLRLRVTWAKFLCLKNHQPEAANKLLIEAKDLLQVAIHHPRILADMADAFYQTNQIDAALSLYTDLRKWHPRAMEKDRAYYGLGLIALEQNRHEEALSYFQRFEKETLGSHLLVQVHQMKTRIYLEKRQYALAKAELDKILELATATRKIKAQALLQLGELHVAQNQDLKATAYFERVYLSYANYPSEAATAYWQRAEALDRLQHTDKALEVYRELATHPALEGQTYQQQAITLLNQRDPQWRFVRTEESPMFDTPP